MIRGHDQSISFPHAAAQETKPHGIVLLYCLACLACIVLFFRHWWQYDLDRLTGDPGDARIAIAVLEHWYSVFKGEADWTSPIFFYPVSGVLGYSETQFLFSIPFSALRAFGCDWYVSYDGALMANKVLGFVGMAILTRNILRLPHWLAILGASTFTVLNTFYLHTNHIQLTTVVLVPFILVLAANYVRYFGRARMLALINGMAAIFVLAFLLFSSFYMGWYICIFLTITVAALAVWSMLRLGFGRVFALCRRHSARVATDLVAIVIVFGICLIPFLIIYLPQANTFGGHPWSTLLLYMQRPIDIIAIGTDNLVWGGALVRLWNYLGPAGKPEGELLSGFTPGILVLFASSVGLACQPRLGLPTLGRDTYVSGPCVRDFVLVAGLAASMFWVLSVRIGQYSLWWLVYSVYPGGTAMRVPARIPVMLAAIVVPIAMVSLDVAWEKLKAAGLGGFSRTALAILAAAFLIVEQVNTAPRTELIRSSEEAALSQIQAPPADCRAFYVIGNAPGRQPMGEVFDSIYLPQVDAMLISQRFHLPTINGMSTWTPPQWELLKVLGPDYGAQVARWADLHSIRQGLCALDLATGQWQLSTPPGP